MIFDDYEESLSASISFVKNLSDKESDDFSESNWSRKTNLKFTNFFYLFHFSFFSL